jgi:hypothetical protein
MEPDDLKTTLQDFAQQLRDDYRCESPKWVMHPRTYDKYEQLMNDGKMSPELAVWFRTYVRRGEIMEP